MPEIIEEGTAEKVEDKKARSLPIVSAALVGIALGTLGGVELSPANINDIINEAKVIRLEEKRITIPEQKEAKEIFDTLGVKIRVDTVTTPAHDIVPIPTRDMWLDSTVKAGDVITVVVQHERSGQLIGNTAFRAEPTDAEVGGKFRVKVMNVR